MGNSKIKYSSQAAPALLSSMREIARQEGRHFHVVMEEAMPRIHREPLATDAPA